LIPLQSRPDALRLSMNMLEYITQQCPYCGENNELSVERSLEPASYVEDCARCCRAMQVDVRLHGDQLLVSLARDDD